MAALRQHSEERAPRVLVSVAGIAVVAIDALYLALINGQGGGPSDTPFVTPFVASYLGLIAFALIGSLFTPPAVKAVLRGAASAGLVVMAVLTGFSIGIAVFVAAAVSVGATAVTLSNRPTRGAVLGAIGGAVVAIAVLAVGLQFAWSHVSCPATGESGGTMAGFVGSSGSYECVNGVLTVGP